MKKRKILYRILIFVISTVFLESNINIIKVASEENTETNTSQQEEENLSETENVNNEDTSEEDLIAIENIPDVNAKLDELMRRALASNNTALKNYVDLQREAFNLQEQTASNNNNLEAVIEGNSGIKTISEVIKAAAETTEESFDGSNLLNLFTESTRFLFSESVIKDNWKDQMEIIESILDLKYLDLVDLLTVKILEAAILADAQEQGTFSEDADKNKVLEVAIEIVSLNLQELEKNKYSEEKFNELKGKSEKFSKTCKLSAITGPSNIILHKKDFALDFPALFYNKNILICVEDLNKYINAKIEYSEYNAVTAIWTKTRKLELTRGKRTCFVNDAEFSMPVEMLYFEGRPYISAESFAEIFEYNYLSLGNTAVIYKALEKTAE